MLTNDPEVRTYSKSLVTSSQRCSAAQVYQCHQSWVARTCRHSARSPNRSTQLQPRPDNLKHTIQRQSKGSDTPVAPHTAPTRLREQPCPARSPSYCENTQAHRDKPGPRPCMSQLARRTWQRITHRKARRVSALLPTKNLYHLKRLSPALTPPCCPRWANTVGEVVSKRFQRRDTHEISSKWAVPISDGNHFLATVVVLVGLDQYCAHAWIASLAGRAPNLKHEGQ